MGSLRYLFATLQVKRGLGLGDGELGLVLRLPVIVSLKHEVTTHLNATKASGTAHTATAFAL